MLVVLLAVAATAQAAPTMRVSAGGGLQGNAAVGEITLLPTLVGPHLSLGTEQASTFRSLYGEVAFSLIFTLGIGFGYQWEASVGRVGLEHIVLGLPIPLMAIRPGDGSWRPSRNFGSIHEDPVLAPIVVYLEPFLKWRSIDQRETDTTGGVMLRVLAELVPSHRRVTGTPRR
jgi:hypothetical protein